jgi:hypothetical protein
MNPPFPTPVGLGFASVLGPTRGRVAKVGDSPPLLNLWGHIPQTPWEGALPPPPPFPTPVGLRFASVLSPTRGGVAKVGDSPPILVLWGDTPQPPAVGACAP